MVVSNNDNPGRQKRPPVILPPKGKSGKEKRTPLEAPGRSGSVRGKVVYDGDPPEMKPIDQDQDPQRPGTIVSRGRRPNCSSKTWAVDKDTKGCRQYRGVVWSRLPASTLC